MRNVASVVATISEYCVTNQMRVSECSQRAREGGGGGGWAGGRHTKLAGRRITIAAGPPSCELSTRILRPMEAKPGGDCDIPMTIARNKASKRV